MCKKNMRIACKGQYMCLKQIHAIDSRFCVETERGRKRERERDTANTHWVVLETRLIFAT